LAFHQRLRERRLDAYDRVIEALGQMLRILDFDIEAYARDGDIPDEVQTANAEAYRRAQQEVARAISLGDYLLDKDAVERLRTHERAMRADPDNPWLDVVLSNRIQATRECIDAMVGLAGKILER